MSSWWQKSLGRAGLTEEELRNNGTSKEQEEQEDNIDGATNIEDLFRQTHSIIDDVNEHRTIDYIPIANKVFNSAEQAAGQGFAGAAKGMGLDSLSDTFQNYADQKQEKLPEVGRPEATLDYLLNGAPVEAGRAWGSLASIAAPMAVAEPLAAASLFPRAAALASKVPGIGQFLATATPWALRSASTTVPESFMEKGSFQREAEANGMSPELASQQSMPVFW